jgi:uncharacterized protein YeeX (DUF496 family)
VSLDDFNKLNNLKLKFLESDLSLKEIKVICFQAKELYNNRFIYLDEYDIRAALDVFK